MKTRLIKFMLSIERAFHLVDAYLYSHQGKQVEAADAQSRAYETERKLVLLEINHVCR